MSDGLLHFNGINGSTGQYGLAPMSGEELMKRICRESAPRNLEDLRRRRQQDDQGSEQVAALEAELAAEKQKLPLLAAGSPELASSLRRCAMLQKDLDLRKDKGVKEGIDATQLAQAGWGVVFAHDADPAVKEALQPLLALRSAQAGPRFKVYEGEAGYRPGESKSRFLVRHGADAAGPADPQRLPYYLLLVGSPERIPFSFQYQLDVQYATGRLHLDKLEEYAAYARSVVEVETRGLPLARRLSFFGVANPDDPATQLSAQQLVQPLHQAMQKAPHGFQVELIPPGQANRAQLARMLGGAETPALLFTASHGVEFQCGDPRQLRHQGALLCQDWPGPRYHGDFKEDFYFAGEHLSSEASLRGMMVFGFACYGAGTPRMDEFAGPRGAVDGRQAIAPRDFVASLPMRMLGHPRGGCLAFIGHVDRAWGYSYTWPEARSKSQTAAFESVLLRLLQGQPVGYALEYFNQRYAELSTVLTDLLQEVSNNLDCDPYELAALWTANNDARGYVVLGDPAARLRFSDQPRTDAQLASVSSLIVPRASPAAGADPVAPALGVPRGLDDVGDEDWAKTPPAVQRAVLRLLAGAAPSSPGAP